MIEHFLQVQLVLLNGFQDNLMLPLLRVLRVPEMEVGGFLFRGFGAEARISVKDIGKLGAHGFVFLTVLLAGLGMERVDAGLRGEHVVAQTELFVHPILL